MRIIISVITLDVSGTPTYTLALYNELVSYGYDVLVYSPISGEMAQDMKTVTSLDHIRTPDIILAQHKTCAESLKKNFPNVPIIFLAHGTLPDEEQPPEMEMDYYISVNEMIADHLIDKGVNPKKIKIVRDFIDVEKFRPTKPLSEKPKVLFISNYKKWRAYRHIQQACSQLGLEFKAVGSPYGRSRNMAETINNYDLIISWGRGILEAMSCGRAVLSYNKQIGEGYITQDNYIEGRKYNFGGDGSRFTFTLEQLIEEIKKYNPEDGSVNRDLVMEYHNTTKCVNQIIGIISNFIKYE